MRLRTIIPSLICAALLAACADATPTGLVPAAAPGVVAAEANPVPLTLHCDCGNFQFPPDQPEGGLHGLLDGVCQISHLGRATVHIDQTDMTTGFDPVRGLVLGWFTGEEVITAANGDVLLIRHEGPTTLNPVTIEVTFGGTIAIHGGTGRFAGATGTGTFAGAASVPGNQGHYDLEAMIQYAAGQRAQK